MSISRGSFLRALIGAPFAAKAVERIIAGGAPKPKVEPIRPTLEPVWARPGAWDPKDFAVSGVFCWSGEPVPRYTMATVSGRLSWARIS